MDNAQTRKFFGWISVLRGIAMLLVVWAHLGSWWLSENHIISKSQVYYHHFFVEPFRLYQEAGHLGVLLFFLVSGWVITHVSLYENRKVFLVKRIFRIFPTLVFAMLVVGLIGFISSFLELPIPLGHESGRIVDGLLGILLSNYFLGTPAFLTVTWTLVIESMFYVLTFFFMPYTIKEPVKATWYMIILVVIGTLLWPLHNPVFLVFTLYILLGRIIYLAVIKKISLLEMVVLGGTDFSFFCFLWAYLTPDQSFPNLATVIYSDLWGLLLFLLGMVLVKKVNRVEKFFADISYSAYLLHLPIGAFFLNLFHAKGIPFKFSLFMTIFIVFSFSYVVYRFLEVPLQRFVRGLIVRYK